MAGARRSPERWSAGRGVVGWGGLLSSGMGDDDGRDWTGWQQQRCQRDIDRSIIAQRVLCSALSLCGVSYQRVAGPPASLREVLFGPDRKPKHNTFAQAAAPT